MPSPPYLVIANPNSKRWQMYSRALSAYWHERGIEPDVDVIPWSLIVPRDGNLDGLAAFNRPALVRLESPGRDWEVTKLLIQAGERETGCGAVEEWDTIPYRKGLLLHPRLYHRGFCRVLRGLLASFNARPHLKPLACPLAVVEMFDKNATLARLAAAEIPCPPSLSPPENPEQLLDALRARRWPTAYVKLAFGSSATGIAVVHALDDPPWAMTSMVRLADGYYNTRRLQTVRGPELRGVLQFILTEGACVQRGIPMAQIDGQNFDVRVVVIHGEPAFTVFRLSDRPMTNLHLGGRRGGWNACRAAVPTRAWLDGIDHAVEAARLYPCATVGVDLVIERGYARHYILEVNAFGDFFPDLVDAQGRGVHRVEIEQAAGVIAADGRRA